MSNLLLPKEKNAILRMYRKRFVAAVFVAVIVVAAVGIVLLAPSLLLTKESEAALTLRHDELMSHETSAIQKTLAASIGDINDRLGVFGGNLPASPLVASLINPVLSAKPASVRLTDFTYDPGANAAKAKVQISGVADSREALLSFADKIKALPNFTEVDVPITSFLKNANVTFTVSAVVATK